ncbi:MULTISPECIES: hypothetical protein [unclassified Luteococcus]|uniref:hypothetical protein n=1 Tax=unclassified Luteococcus TaxID=2639923 RepID=UPI00313D31B9
MITNPTPIPEPTPPTAVPDEVVEAAWQDLDAELTPYCFEQSPREVLRAALASAEAKRAELEADKPEPGPWLTGDELEAIMPTLKAGDVVEVERKGRTATGKLHSTSGGGLALWSLYVRLSGGEVGTCVDALRIIERAPKPEPERAFDQVVEAAVHEWRQTTGSDHEAMRAALAAADAKRAELEGRA